MIEQLVEQIESRFADVQRQLSDPEVIGDRQRYRDAGRAYSELEPAAKLAELWRRAADDAAGARELLAEDGDDAEVRELLSGARARLEELEEEIRLAMVERDPNDDKNVIVEIRGGAGGDEAGLFAGDLYRMLTKYAERRGLRRRAALVGDGEYTFAVKGDGAYSVFKFEGGTHRVQRVPETESQGRIHTSTATVAVLPEAEDVDVDIDPNDLQIDVYRSSGPGGQSVNTTDSAVRITHKPSGIVVSMQDEKSQLQNREKALRVLRARLYERAHAEQQAELAADRRSQVGTGERAEKIRTYNFPQGRVTDHRIKLTVHNLDGVLDGDLDELTGALEADEKRRRLEAQAGGVSGAAPWPPVRASLPAPAGDRVRRPVASGSARRPRIAAAGCDTPRLDAELLLAHALGSDRAALVREAHRTLAAHEAERFDALVARREHREPVAYIVGRKGFRHIELEVDARVLIPRPETELLVEAALELPRAARVVDVGTGQRRGRPRAQARASRPRGHGPRFERRCARRRARQRRAARPRRRAAQADLLDGGSYDAVLANLPYVAEADWAGLGPEIVRFEPRTALVAADRGLALIRRLVAALPRDVRFAALEVGAGQAAEVGEMLVGAGFDDLETRRDLAGIERVVLARR